MASVKLLGSSYKHEQNTPSALWVINHRLGRTALVDCYVSFQGSLRKIIPADVIRISDDVTHVEFSIPFTGEARAI